MLLWIQNEPPKMEPLCVLVGGDAQYIAVEHIVFGYWTDFRSISAADLHP